MGTQRTSFDKLQRDRAKKLKASQKREARLNKEPAAEPEIVDDGGELSAEALLKIIEEVHRAFDAKEISFEDFEEKKADLMARLPIS